MKAFELKTDHLIQPLGIDSKNPRLTWKCLGGVTQTAYNVRAFNEIGELVFESGKVNTDDMFCIYQGKELESRDKIDWQVILWDENGNCETSDQASFEMGLLNIDDWQAKWICGVDTNTKERLPADYYKKNFLTKGEVKKARLYATACGTYEVRIDSKRVEGYILAPGCTEYEKRLYYQTYDVTDMLKPESVIEFIVGDGWYKGKVGCDGVDNFFGSQTKLLAQLEITYSDGQTDIIATDASFLWCNNGQVRYNDLRDGIVYDACKQPSYTYFACETSNEINPTASNAPGIKEHEHFLPKLLISPSGKKILDFGQNLAGYIKFSIKGIRGNSFSVRMFEALDCGEYSDRTFATLPERGATINQEIKFTFSGNDDVFEPNFFYSGFRYALIEGIDEVNPENFKAVALYSDMEFTGKFECSNKMINQFVNNTIWSQKSNFIDIPTDCPHRERNGWTGDAQIFAKAGTYFADTAAFFRKWLKDVRDCQREDGRVKNVCPKTDPKGMGDVLNGSVGWADAAVIIPYTLWKMYGDESFITDNYELMHNWKKYVMNAAADKSLYNLPEGHQMKALFDSAKLPDSPYNKYIIETGLHWGEWNEPKDVFSIPATIHLAIPKQEETSAYMHYSMSLLTEMLEAIGKSDEAAVCKEYSEGAKSAYNFHFVKDDDIDTIRQAKLVRPLALGLLNEKAQKNVARRLNEVAMSRNYKVGTGFLSTPFVLPMLVKYGYVDTAYRMLENTESPGWLAMVKQGATTVWENYEGYDNESHPTRSSMNHFSPGAVCEFLFTDCCGIRLSGKNHFHIQPVPGGTLTYANAEYNSAYGMVRSKWIKEKGKYTLEISIPSNATATICLPDGQKFEVAAGMHKYHWSE